MDAKVDTFFFRIFLNDVHLFNSPSNFGARYSPYLGNHIPQPSSSNALDGGRPLLLSASSKRLSDIDGRNEN